MRRRTGRRPQDEGATQGPEERDGVIEEGGHRHVGVRRDRSVDITVDNSDRTGDHHSTADVGAGARSSRSCSHETRQVDRSRAPRSTGQWSQVVPCGTTEIPSSGCELTSLPRQGGCIASSRQRPSIVVELELEALVSRLEPVTAVEAMRIRSIFVARQLNPIAAQSTRSFNGRREQGRSDPERAMVGVNMHRFDLGASPPALLKMAEGDELTDPDDERCGVAASYFGNENRPVRVGGALFDRSDVGPKVARIFLRVQRAVHQELHQPGGIAGHCVTHDDRLSHESHDTRESRLANRADATCHP